MSMQLMTAVWDAQLQPARKLVLLALADWANDRGEQCFPSIARIAARASISDRQAQRHLQALVESGWVSRAGTHGPTGRATTWYKIAADRLYRVHSAAEEKRRAARESRLRGDESVTGDAGVTPQVTPAAARGGMGVTQSTSTQQREEEQERCVAAAAPIHTSDTDDGQQVEQKSQPVKRAARNSHGTRLLDGWTPDAELLAWAELRRPDVDSSLETEKFVNYWLATPGAKGRKLSWPATWKNWILGAHTSPSRRSLAPSEPSKTMQSLEALHAFANRRANPDPSPELPFLPALD